MTVSVFTRLRELEQKATPDVELDIARALIPPDVYALIAARNLFPLLLDVAEKAEGHLDSAYPTATGDRLEAALAVFVAAAEKEIG